MTKWIKWLFTDEKPVNDFKVPSTFDRRRWFPDIVHAEYKDGILTAEYDFGDYKETMTFKGSSTVWATYPMMRSVPTSTEMRLYDVYKYICEHGNPYPTAHLKKEISNP